MREDMARHIERILLKPKHLNLTGPLLFGPDDSPTYIIGIDDDHPAMIGIDDDHPAMKVKGQQIT
jgi:hypothetical protein